jgi:hypothetical protein
MNSEDMGRRSYSGQGATTGANGNGNSGIGRASPRLRAWQVDPVRETVSLRSGLQRVEQEHEQEHVPAPPEWGLAMDEVRRAEATLEDTSAGARNWWTGARIESAFSAIHAAEGWLVLLEHEDELRAWLPSLRASVEATMHEGDTRRHEYISYLTKEIDAKDHEGRYLDRELLRRMLCEVRRISDNSQRKLRRFRNHLLVVALATLFVALLVPVIASFHGDFDVVCATEDALQSVPPNARVAELRSCPDGTQHAHGEDIWLIELFGALGGLVTVLATVQRMRPHQVSGGLFYAQLMLKVSAGALTGLLGVALVQNGVVRGVAAHAGWAVFVYAFIFGVAQDSVTRFADRKGSELLGEATTKNEIAHIAANA